MKESKWMLVGVVLVAAVALCGCGRKVEVPAELIGTWEATSDDRYEDASFEITDATITFRKGFDHIRRNTIISVKTTTVGGDKIEHEIAYRDYAGGDLSLSLYYFPRVDGGMIRFKFQDDIAWHRGHAL